MKTTLRKASDGTTRQCRQPAEVERHRRRGRAAATCEQEDRDDENSEASRSPATGPRATFDRSLVMRLRAVYETESCCQVIMSTLSRSRSRNQTTEATAVPCAMRRSIPPQRSWRDTGCDRRRCRRSQRRQASAARRSTSTSATSRRSHRLAPATNRRPPRHLAESATAPAIRRRGSAPRSRPTRSFATSTTEPSSRPRCTVASMSSEPKAARGSTRPTERGCRCGRRGTMSHPTSLRPTACMC